MAIGSSGVATIKHGVEMKGGNMLRIVLVLAGFAAASELSVEGGRYVFGQLGEARADKYMLDTQTGRVWQVVLDTNGTRMLESVDYAKTKIEKDIIVESRNSLPFPPDSSEKSYFRPKAMAAPAPEPKPNPMGRIPLLLVSMVAVIALGLVVANSD